MIEIIKVPNGLHLKYEPDARTGSAWLPRKLEEEGRVTLSRVWTFLPTDLLPPSVDSLPVLNKNDMELSSSNSESSGYELIEEEAFVFKLGLRSEDYFFVPARILGLEHDLLLHESMKINRKTFVAERGISVFRKIDDVVGEPIVIGGDREGCIPVDEFEYLLKNFPTTTEMNHYSHAQITRILKDYFEVISDAEAKLNDYLHRKTRLNTKSVNIVRETFELQKFEFIRDEIHNMLNESEGYCEKTWQSKILDLILLIYPKYIAVLEEVGIADFYSNPNKISKRKIDLMLVDASGAIDIIEIKKPKPRNLLTMGFERNNHIPKRALIGAVMQAEKYLFYLDKWGRAGEIKIQNDRTNELPPELELRIANPRALLIMGRDNDFVGQQKLDFEIVRRKYTRVMDIITYDDLLRRLDSMIVMLKKHTSII